MISIFTAPLQSDILIFFFSKFLRLVVWLVCLIHCLACICLLVQFMMLNIHFFFFSYVRFSFANLGSPVILFK